MPVFRNVSLGRKPLRVSNHAGLNQRSTNPRPASASKTCILIILSEKQGSLLLMRIVILARIVQMVRHDFVFVSDSSARKRCYRPKSTLP